MAWLVRKAVCTALLVGEPVTRWLTLCYQHSQWQVLGFAEIVDAANEIALAQALRVSWQQQNIRVRHVASAVDASKVIRETVVAPADLADEDIAAFLQMQLEERLQQDLDDFLFDYYRTPEQQDSAELLYQVTLCLKQKALRLLNFIKGLSAQCCLLEVLEEKAKVNHSDLQFISNELQQRYLSQQENFHRLTYLAKQGLSYAYR